MANQTTQKKVKYVGKQGYINADTGEYKEMYVTDIEDRDFNFSKVWMKNFLLAMDIVGNQKTKVAFWIIDHAKGNVIIGTQRDLAEQVGVSYQTLNTTLKLLMNADFLRMKQSGVYVINPDLVFKGTRQSRMNVLQQYHDAPYTPLTDEEKLSNLLKSKAELDKQIQALQQQLETKSQIIPGQLSLEDEKIQKVM